jgi:hypothetical protein
MRLWMSPRGFVDRLVEAETTRAVIDRRRETNWPVRRHYFLRIVSLLNEQNINTYCCDENYEHFITEFVAQQSGQLCHQFRGAVKVSG